MFSTLFRQIWLITNHSLSWINISNLEWNVRHLLTLILMRHRQSSPAAPLEDWGKKTPDFSDWFSMMGFSLQGNLSDNFCIGQAWIIHIKCILGGVLIDTLDQSDQHSWFTLDGHLDRYLFDIQSPPWTTLDWHLVDGWPSDNRDVDWVLI